MKILVVDRDGVFQLGFRTYLRNTDHVMLSASDIAAAHGILARDKDIDAILIGKGRSGDFDTLSFIQGLERGRYRAIVATYENDSDQEAIEAAGCTAVIAKSAPPDQILQMLLGC